MKLKGIIPELKMIEGSNQVGYYLDNLRPYPVISINTSGLFCGNLEMLCVARQMFPNKFIIRKDFIMVPKQIKESKEAGADAVLLIYEFLEFEQYKELIKACKKCKIMPIVEINWFGGHEDTWYEKNKLRSIQIEGSVTILVNSRDLNTGYINKKYAEYVCKRLEVNGIKDFIYASGEKSDRVVKKGIADAVLIGTAFMQGKLK